MRYHPSPSITLMKTSTLPNNWKCQMNAQDHPQTIKEELHLHHGNGPTALHKKNAHMLFPSRAVQSKMDASENP